MKKGYFRNVINEAYVTGQQPSKKVWAVIGLSSLGARTLGVYTDENQANAEYERLSNEGGGDYEDFDVNPVELNQPITFHDSSDVNESYIKPKAASKYVYYDRSMQPGGGPGSAEYVQDLEDVKEIIEYSMKVKTPVGVDMWEDPEGNILIKVK